MSTPLASRRNVLRGAILVGAGTAVGGGAVLTTQLAHAEVPTPEIASTSDWGARPHNGLDELDSSPNKIVIHHMATGNSSDYSREHAYDLAYQVQGWHMNDNGWTDSGHHFAISRGGYIMEGRHTSLQHLTDGSGFVQGAHAPGANSDGIGIENEGTYTSETPNQELWDAMVAFCAYACQQYGIASSEIYGHRDFVSTACPGDALYAQLPELREAVQAAIDGGGADPEFEQIVDNADEGMFALGAGWELSSYSDEKNGDDYAFAEPADEDGKAVFSAEIPKDGAYTVDTWYSANADYNPSAPYVVHAADGDTDVSVDQTTKGGQWVPLGEFTLKAGQQELVSVGRDTDGAGYILADAIRVRSKE